MVLLSSLELGHELSIRGIDYNRSVADKLIGFEVLNFLFEVAEFIVLRDAFVEEVSGKGG